jgi:hypothetical protein
MYLIHFPGLNITCYSFSAYHGRDTPFCKSQQTLHRVSVDIVWTSKVAAQNAEEETWSSAVSTDSHRISNNRS